MLCLGTMGGPSRTLGSVVRGFLLGMWEEMGKPKRFPLCPLLLFEAWVSAPMQVGSIWICTWTVGLILMPCCVNCGRPYLGAAFLVGPGLSFPFLSTNGIERGLTALS